MKLVKNQVWFLEDSNRHIVNFVSNDIYMAVLKIYSYSQYRFRTLNEVGAKTNVFIFQPICGELEI